MPAALAAAALLLGACGGDSTETVSESAAPGSAATTPETTSEESAGEGGADGQNQAKAEDGARQGPSDAEQVEAAIEALLTDPDSERVCREVMTKGLVQTAYGDVQGCLSGRGAEPLARSVKIKGFNGFHGDRVAGVVVPKGGLYGGEELEVEAVRAGGAWRIDGFVADIPVGP
ncbi:MAG TPA: hypothetical protein VKA36_06250 [Solirubrobacterales bacterium]|nr:hypothetical protein [Solirubrobacterales bacterium]